MIRKRAYVFLPVTTPHRHQTAAGARVRDFGRFSKKCKNWWTRRTHRLRRDPLMTREQYVLRRGHTCARLAPRAVANRVVGPRYAGRHSDIVVERR